jgi:phosphoribosylglycinamide formyltransferase 2
MVTLVGQQPNEFELHLRAILGLPVSPIIDFGPSASAVILADRASSGFRFEGLGEALALGTPESPVEVRLFGKPQTLPGRRMGVTLARAPSVAKAIEKAKAAAAAMAIVYEEES